MREPKKKKNNPNVIRDHTFFLLLFSCCITHFGLCKMCWRPNRPRKKKYKQIERGAAKLLWWHFHFFSFFSVRLLFFPHSVSFVFLLLYTQEIRWLSISGVANSHTHAHNPQSCTLKMYYIVGWMAYWMDDQLVSFSHWKTSLSHHRSAAAAPGALLHVLWFIWHR